MLLSSGWPSDLSHPRGNLMSSRGNPLRRMSLPDVPRLDGPGVMADAPPSVSSSWRRYGLALLATFIVALPWSPSARADYIITGGSASFNITQGLADSIDHFDALFNATTTEADCLSLPAPGNEAFTVPNNIVTYDDPIRPFDATLPTVTGRTPQATTLQISDPSNVLGSWTTSNDAGTFVGSSTLGDQIAFTSMQHGRRPALLARSCMGISAYVTQARS